MNISRLKSYAPQARRDFISAVTNRAAKVGVTANSAAPVQMRGDLALINGQAFPREVATQRKVLDDAIRSRGFSVVVEEAAYTWFNRFMAIRYMELHNYLSHGYRVLSDPDGGIVPEIMEYAQSVVLPGIRTDQVIALKLDGTKDEELYKLLLLGQCRALHEAMPFLFEPIDDVTELLLPDLLLSTDSIVRKMASSVGSADWERIEVVGWLYQFYISEKKNEVIGKVVKTEDIPAATQLFTPEWIVKYMIQNSLGRKWLATYPHSALKGNLEYYIEPAEQTEAVQIQVNESTPQSLNPEEITFIDPACGSGHILVEAYSLFKEMYLERGYRLRDIPRLILEKNLFGLEIDERAAQMAGFALIMKARADDRNILTNTPVLNVLALQASANLDVGEMISLNADVARRSVNSSTITRNSPMEDVPQPPSVLDSPFSDLLNLFRDSKTFGSLIRIPPEALSPLGELEAVIAEAKAKGGLLTERNLFIDNSPYQASQAARP